MNDRADPPPVPAPPPAHVTPSTPPPAAVPRVARNRRRIVVAGIVAVVLVSSATWWVRDRSPGPLALDPDETPCEAISIGQFRNMLAAGDVADCSSSPSLPAGIRLPRTTVPSELLERIGTTASTDDRPTVPGSPLSRRHSFALTDGEAYATASGGGEECGAALAIEKYTATGKPLFAIQVEGAHHADLACYAPKRGLVFVYLFQAPDPATGSFGRQDGIDAYDWTTGKKRFEIRMTGVQTFPVTAVGADERHLYVSDYPRRHVRRYDLAALEGVGRAGR